MNATENCHRMQNSSRFFSISTVYVIKISSKSEFSSLHYSTQVVATPPFVNNNEIGIFVLYTSENFLELSVLENYTKALINCVEKQRMQHLR